MLLVKIIDAGDLHLEMSELDYRFGLIITSLLLAVLAFILSYLLSKIIEFIMFKTKNKKEEKENGNKMKNKKNNINKQKNKVKLKEKLFVVFHRKTILKSIELVLKYTGINPDLATRKKIENGLLHPIRESIKQKKRKKQQCQK